MTQECASLDTMRSAMIPMEDLWKTLPAPGFGGLPPFPETLGLLLAFLQLEFGFLHVKQSRVGQHLYNAFSFEHLTLVEHIYRQIHSSLSCGDLCDKVSV